MKWKTWSKLYIFALISILVLSVVSFEVSLYRLNENFGLRQAIEKQIETDGLYGRALVGSEAQYKLEMAKKMKPDILILGSSRVMQFRNDFFNKELTFYNAGGGMNNIDEGIWYIEELTKYELPKTIILGIDIWWLNANWNDGSVDKNNIFISNNRMFLYGALISKVDDFGTDLLNNYNIETDPYSNAYPIGLFAAKYGDGFRIDGSYQYGGLLSGKRKDTDENFKDTLERIRTGTSRFEFGNCVDKDRLERLHKLINLLKEKNINVIAFTPPFADEVYTTLENSENHRELLRDFNKQLALLFEEENIPFYNYGNITWYGSNDNETIDGFHGNEVSYAKLSLDMTKNNALVKSYFDVNSINKFINISY